MSQNLQRFRGMRLERPTTRIPVPQLVGSMFDSVEEAFFTLRGLNSNDMFMAREARALNSPLKALADAAAEAGPTALKDAFTKIFSDPNKSTAAEMAFRSECIRFGVVDPDTNEPLLDNSDVAILSEHYPLVFLQVSEKILALSGQASVHSGEASGHSGKIRRSRVP